MSNPGVQNILNICIFSVTLFLVVYVINSNVIEGYEEEECVYDPVVQKLKNKVEKWIEARKNPWAGHLDCLNHKKKEVIHNLKMCKGESSYTINKKTVYLCVKDDEDNYYPEHMLMHVLLHELSHAICDEVGHTKKFDDIFTALMEEADSPTCKKQFQIYDKSKPLIQNYCGLNEKDTYST